MLGTGLMQPSGLPAVAAAASDSEPAVEKNGVKFWLVNSLTRVYPNSPVGSAAIPALTTARNARVSFQACFRNLKDCSIRVRATVEGADDFRPQVRRVGYVPLQQLNTDVPLDEVDGVGHVPGLAPDPLFPEVTAHVGPAANGTFWITLWVPADAKVGEREFRVRLTVEDTFRFPGWTGEKPVSVELPVRVNMRPLVLQKRKDFPATNWISADSIWEYYKIEPYSERFWELADAYIKNLTEHNFNTIYSPIFNARHEILKRPAQLLRVRRVGDDKYEFDFSDVRRWIGLARKNGAEHLEWTHFFTPAPTSGRYPQRIFERWDKLGPLLWPPEISAVSATYRKFLEQFLPQFKSVLEEEQMLDRSFFHCADEPDGDVQMEDYRKARTHAARNRVVAESDRCDERAAVRDRRPVRNSGAQHRDRASVSRSQMPSLGVLLLWPAWAIPAAPARHAARQIANGRLVILQARCPRLPSLGAQLLVQILHERNRRPVPRPRGRRVARASVRRPVRGLPGRRWTDRFDPLGGVCRIVARLCSAAIGRHQPRRPAVRRVQELRGFSEERAVDRSRGSESVVVMAAEDRWRRGRPQFALGRVRN